MIDGNERYSEFQEYHSLILDMAYLSRSGMIVGITQKGEQYLNITWKALLDALKLNDTGFTNIDDMLGDKDLGDYIGNTV